MTRKISTLFALFILTMAVAVAQTSDDNITFLKVQNQMTDGNYYKALETLSTISYSGKSSSFYLSYSATCYEKTYQYDKAGSFYKQLYSKTNNFDAMKKVAEMEEFQENKANAIKADSVLTSNPDIKALERSIFKNDRDATDDKVVIIARTDKGHILMVFNLPSFDFKLLTTFDLEPKKPENKNEASFFIWGDYNIKFRGEYSPCNALVPKKISFIGQVNEYYNTLFLALYNYNCTKKPDGTFEATKMQGNDTDDRKYTKTSSFSFN